MGSTADAAEYGCSCRPTRFVGTPTRDHRGVSRTAGWGRLRARDFSPTSARRSSSRYVGLRGAALRASRSTLLDSMYERERERQGKDAGPRTHMLAAIGAALFVMVPMFAGLTRLERIIEYIITSIGFIGAGSIIKQHSPEHVLGLTTAAGVWVTAAIGVARGLGRGLTAIVRAVLSLAVPAALRHFVERYKSP